MSDSGSVVSRRRRSFRPRTCRRRSNPCCRSGRARRARPCSPGLGRTRACRATTSNTPCPPRRRSSNRRLVPPAAMLPPPPSPSPSPQPARVRARIPATKIRSKPRLDCPRLTWSRRASRDQVPSSKPHSSAHCRTTHSSAPIQASRPSGWRSSHSVTQSKSSPHFCTQAANFEHSEPFPQSAQQSATQLRHSASSEAGTSPVGAGGRSRRRPRRRRTRPPPEPALPQRKPA